MPRVLISLGSNLGDRRRLLDDAVTLLAALPQTSLVARSAWYETSPIGGPPGQEPFLNGAVLLESSLTPQQCLAELQQIETSLGRVRKIAWGPRTIDLDLLLYDGRIIHEPQLVVPHRRLSFRKFVLRGAVEIAGAMRHPVLERSLSELYVHLQSVPRYAALVGMSHGFRSQLTAEAADAARARLVEPTAAGIPATLEEVDAHGLSAVAAIEFIEARAAAVRQSSVEAGESWIADDAWITAEAVAASARLAGEERNRFDDWWRQAESTMPTPRLLVSVGTKTSTAAETVRAVKGSARFEIQLPPTVDIDLTDREQALTEIAAALEAAD